MKRLLVLLLLLFGSASPAWGAATVTTYTTPGTFTWPCPAGVTTATFEAISGGAGGGPGVGSNGGGGGGSGGYGSATVAVIPGTNYTVTVGAAAAAAANGTLSSIVGGGATYSVTGALGSQATGTLNVGASTFVGFTTTANGAHGGNRGSSGGGGGSQGANAAGASQNGLNGSGATPGGAKTSGTGGTGGAGGASTANGSAGGNYGGAGGGGGGTGGLGGAGAQGWAQITYTPAFTTSVFSYQLGSVNSQIPLVSPHTIDPTDTTATAGSLPVANRGELAIKAKNGDTLLFFMGYGGTVGADTNQNSIYFKRALAGYSNWQPAQLVWRCPTWLSPSEWVQPCSVAVNAVTGTIHLIFTHFQNTQTAKSDTHLVHAYSNDHGATWKWHDGTAFASNADTGDLTHGEISSTIGGHSVAGPLGGVSNAKLVVTTTENIASWGDVRGWGTGIQLTNGAHAGRLIFPMYHRAAPNAGDGTNGSTTGFAHTLISDNDGDSLTYQAIDDTNSANNGWIEWTLRELPVAIGARAQGDLVGIARINGAFIMGYSYSTDGGGLTWAGLAHTTMPTSGCEGAVEVTPDGYLYSTSQAETFVRAHLMLYVSIDGGATWPIGRTIWYGYAGYSSLLAYDATHLVAFFEHSRDYAGASGVYGNGVYNYAQYGGQVIVSNDWIAGSAMPVVVQDLQLNEDVATKSVGILGQQLKDQSGWCNNASGGIADGTTASGAKFTSTGISTDGTSNGICLSQYIGSGGNSVGGVWEFLATDSFTTELVNLAVDASASAGQVLLDNRHSVVSTAGSASGITVLLSGTKTLQVVVSDGTNATSVTGTTVLSDGVARCIQIERDQTVSPVVVRIKVNGVTEGSTTDTTTLPILAPNTIPMTFGGYTAKFCKTTIGRIRLTRGGLQTSYLTGAETKVAPAAYIGYSPTVVGTSPASFGSCVSWIGNTYNGATGLGAFGSPDISGGYDVGTMPPINGQGISACRDLIDGQFWQSPGAYEGGYWTFDSCLDWAVRSALASGISGGFLADTLANSRAKFDPIFQNSGVFSIAIGGIRFNSDVGPGTSQTVLDNIKASGSNAGINLILDGTTKQLQLLLTKGDGTLLSEKWGPVLAIGTRYFIGYTCAGPGNHVILYVGTYSTSHAAPVLTAYSSTGTLAAIDVSPIASGFVLNQGQRTGNGVPADMTSKNWSFYNAALTAGNMTALAKFSIVVPVGVHRDRLGPPLRRPARDLLGRPRSSQLSPGRRRSFDQSDHFAVAA